MTKKKVKKKTVAIFAWEALPLFDYSEYDLEYDQVNFPLITLTDLKKSLFLSISIYIYSE